MAKKEKFAGSEKKTPFAVMRKGALCAVLGAGLLAGGVLVGCEEGSITAPAGVKFYYGTEDPNPTDNAGKVGDFYIETDDGDVWQLTDNGWEEVANIKGPQGLPGITPTIAISEDGYWVVNNVKTNVKAEGSDGQKGEDAITPTISPDGYWIINNQKTEFKAVPEDGKNGEDAEVPTFTVSDDGYWVIGGQKTEYKAQGDKGADAVAPVITINNEGYWCVDGKSTGVKAQGEKGADAEAPVVSIDKDGYWCVDGESTGVKAQGEKGADAVAPVLTINNEGYWCVNGDSTGIKAQGEKGADAVAPVITINNEGYWCVDGNSTGIKAQGEKGADAITPTISEDGYWIINNQKTEFKAVPEDGKNGEDAEAPTFTVSDDGYWEINGQKTEYKAKGDNGKDAVAPEVSINKDGFWCVDGESTGVEAQGVSVTDVTVEYGFDMDGNSYMDMTFHYSKGKPTTDRVYTGQTMYVGSVMSLEKAFEVAPVGATIELNTDVELSAPVRVTKRQTLNLNGHKIYNTEDIWDENTEIPQTALISVLEGGDLTIKDEIKMSVNPGYGGADDYNYEESAEGKIVAKLNDCFAVDLRGGDCTINDGVFIGNMSSIYIKEGHLTINGGEFAIQQLQGGPTQAQPWRTGHEFVINCYDESFTAGTASFVINGGEFQGFNPAKSYSENSLEPQNFVGEGFQVISISSQQGVTYGVVSTEEALEMLAYVGEYAPGMPIGITLAGDIEVSQPIIIDNGVDLTVNLNGNSITRAEGFEGNVFIINEGGSLTIGDEKDTEALEGKDYLLNVNALPQGYAIKDNGGFYTVGKFENLISENKAGVVSLQSDIEGLDDCYINSDIELNLNNHNITFNDNMIFIIRQGHFNITGTGQVIANSDAYGTIQVSGRNVDDETYSKLTVGENVTLKNLGADTECSYTISVVGTGNGQAICYNTSVDFAGKSVGSNGAISVGGKIKTGAPVINIKSTAVITAIGHEAMYLAGNNICNIAEGAQITGKTTAIEIRAGQLNVAGGTIVAQNETFETSANGSGGTVKGAAIAISQHTTNQAIAVNITGGTYTGIYALYEIDTVEADATKSENVAISVSGGEFNGTVASVNNKLAVTGGTFLTDPTAYVDTENYDVVAGDGSWSVTEKEVQE